MKAAILEKIGAPLTVADIDLPEKLERGQVLVKVLRTGICGSQLQEIDGIKGDLAHLPHLLGHEGCGIVEDFGEGVTTVKKGDKVVMHWRKGEGIEAEPATYPGGIKAGPITTFSEYAVVSENRITAIPESVPNDLAALLGCALSTALSLIEKEANLKRYETVLIIGCGGVGLALIIAARIVNPLAVFAYDTAESKRPLVKNLGAHFKKHLIAGYYDLVIDTVGEYRHFGQRYISLQKNGSIGGGFVPHIDIPFYTNLLNRGFLGEYHKLITHRIALDKINDGIQLMRDGKAGRVMIEMR